MEFQVLKYTGGGYKKTGTRQNPLIYFLSGYKFSTTTIDGPNTDTTKLAKWQFKVSVNEANPNINVFNISV